MGIRDSFFFYSGAGHPDDAATLFQLVNHFFRDPGFSEKALSLAKIRYRQQYEKSERTLDGKMKIDGDRFLAGNDPRFGIPAPETLDQYTLEDVKNWILPHISQAPIEISIVGDIDTDVMTQLAARYLGSLGRREPFARQPERMGPVRFPYGEKRILTVDTKIESAIVRVAFLTDDFWDIAQTRQLSLLAQVLSERVRKKIREELGESYSPYVYNHPSSIFKGYGVMHMVVKIQPGSQDIVFEKLKAIVDSVLSSGITEKETRFALNPVLTHLKTLRESNRYWLNSVMVNSSVYPEKFDWARSLLSGYQQIDRKDLVRLAKKYLVWKKHAGIVIVPKDQSN